MNFQRPLSIIVLLGASLARAIVAQNSPPLVQVSAQDAGETFKYLIAQNDVPELLNYVAAQAALTAQIAHPCMEWSAAKESPGSTKPSARLTLVFQRIRFGRSFRIHLFYRAALGDKPEQALSDRLKLVVISPLQELEPPEGLKRVKELLSKRITEQISNDWFKEDLGSELIRHVGIASTIQLAEQCRRVIVPIDACRLNLAAGSPLLIDFDSTLCTTAPESCEIKIISLGLEASGTQLWCKPESSTCCGPLSSDDTCKLQEIKVKSVFLDENHKHCSSFQAGQAGCPKDGLSRKIGASGKGCSS